MAQPNGAQAPVTPIRTLPPVPPFNSPSTGTTHIPDSLPASQQPPPTLSQIPDLLLQMLNSITATLRSVFSEKPPHTIQRLAELVLFPTKYYRTLPAWLRAVDRTVSVSSTADIFPLPHAQPLPNSVIDSSLLNGVHGDGASSTGTGTGGGGILWDNTDSQDGYDASLGSDESLGGALLTPIPWLKNGVSSSDESSTGSDMLSEPIDALATGTMVPEREDGAVTQGELIRQEQQAGVVPASRSAMGPSRMMAGAEETSGGITIDDEGQGESIPHARGPDLVGTVDMGLVGGRGFEVQIGSKKERGQDDGNVDLNVNDAQEVLMNAGQPRNDSDHAEEPGQPAGERPEEMQLDIDPAVVETGDDANADIVLTDADGKIEDSEQRADRSGENIGPDASDTSVV